MSRCFPYPPPGYTLSSARNEALIESIKLQKEKERKKEKKEKKKEKKKRKEKKEKRKDETNPDLDKSNIPKHCISHKLDTPKHHISDKLETPKHHISNKSDIPNHRITKNGSTGADVEFLHKQNEAETDQLERSSLTEEHAGPARLPVPSSSSESTDKSKKRKRNLSPGDDTHVQGKVIMLRLPSKKRNELDALAKEKPCSASERSDMPEGRIDVDCGEVPAKFLNGTSKSTAHHTDQICSTSGQIEAGKTGINNKPLFHKKAILTPMQKLELQYTILLEDCFPPPIEDGCVFPTDDLDWLLVGRNQETRAEKKSRFGNESLSCSRSLGLWPRAEYLPEVEIYALPYTMPY